MQGTANELALALSTFVPQYLAVHLRTDAMLSWTLTQPDHIAQPNQLSLENKARCRLRKVGK